MFRRWLIISFIGFPHTWLILSFIGFPHTLLFAQAIQERSLVVIAVERKPFFLRINGRLINQKPRTHIRMDGLMENFYFLEVRQIGGVIIKKTVYVPPGSEIVYQIGSQGELGLVGVYPNGQNAIVHDNNFSAHAAISKSENLGCRAPVSATLFALILKQIRHKKSDDERLQMARKIVGEQCITSRQVLHLLRLFDFDDHRMELAQYAYQYVYDPENYRVVLKGFSEPTTGELLLQYLEGKTP